MTSADSSWLEARSKVFLPGLRGQLKDKYEACRVCQEISRLHYENPPILVNQELAEVLQPMDELRVDWGSDGKRHFHVVVDLSTSFLWAKDYQLMSTENSTPAAHQLETGEEGLG